MALLQKDLFNSPYSGVFCATNDLVTLVPPGIPDDDMEAISEALGTKVEVITIGGSSVSVSYTHLTLPTSDLV